MDMPPWTFSRLEKFQNCPRQFYHVHVKKDVTDTPGEAAIWGDTVHKALEHRLRDGTPLPEGMTQWEAFVAKLAAKPGEKLCEQAMAIDKNFQPSPWSGSWSRGKADVLVINGHEALALDYKTGKRKLTDQLALYAGYTFAHYESVQVVSAGFIWLKDKKVDKETYTRQDVPKIWDKFLPKVRKLEVAYEKDVWPCKPSGLCRGWCPVKTCEFYKNK